jgi:hypothetical protein
MAVNTEVGAVDVKTMRTRDLDLDEAARRFPASGTETDLGTTTGAITLTAAQVLGGYITSSNATAANGVMPTAAAIVAALPQPKAGERLTLSISARGAGTFTLSGAATGVTYRGTVVVAAGGSKVVSILITNVTAASEAITVYA